MTGPLWDDTEVLWDDLYWTWEGDALGRPAPSPVPSQSAQSWADQVLENPDLHSQQDIYHATSRRTHKVGSWLQILDEDEKPMWEVAEILDGSVSWDTSSAPVQSLSVTVLDPKGKLGATPFQEQVLARRFVRAIVGKETSFGWIRFPLFTGPVSSGGMSRQGALVTLNAESKESLYLEPYTTWRAQTHFKGKPIVDAIHDIAYSMGERKFRLPENVTARLSKNASIPAFEEPWKWIQQLAGRIGRVAFFDPEGYLGLRPKTFKTVHYTFDESIVLTPPEIEDDYTTLINATMVAGPDPEGPKAPPKVRAQIPKASPFSPSSMARNDEPRRAIATDEMEKKKLEDLKEHAREMLAPATRTISFDALPVPHLRPGMYCRLVGEFEGDIVDEKFYLKSGSHPLTVAEPMTIGTWGRVGRNWRTSRKRQPEEAHQ